MRKRKNHDFVRLDLAYEGKGGAINRGHPAIWSIAPLRRCARKLKDRLDNGVDLVFQLDSEPPYPIVGM